MINSKKYRFHWRHGFAIAALALLCACGEQRFLAPEAPDFTLPTLDGGGAVSLREYRGDVVYVAFWASWCIPCREEMPHLMQLWEQHRDAGFQVIGINVDDDVDAARQFAADYGIKFPLVRDEDRAVSKLYRVAGYPSHYIVGRRGRVHFSALGFTEDDALAVTQEVQTRLRGSADEAD